jgi:hypothetical protein
MKTEPTQEQRMDRSAWFLLVFAAVFLLLSLAQIAYRFTLPTDGWSVYTEDLDNPDWIFYTNLVGTPSGLQPEDTLIAVGDRSMLGTASLGYLARPANWQAGKTVTMIIQRADQQVLVDIPIVHWTLRSIWRYNFENLTQFASTVSAVLFLFIGGLTFLRRPSLPSARALLMLSTAIAASFISGILPDGLSVQFDQLANTTTSFYSYLIFGTFLAPSLLAFSLLFPQPKHAIQHRPWLAFLPYGFGLSLLIYFFSGGQAWQAGWYTTLGMFVASVISLTHAGFTQRDGVSRAQLRWAISGFVLGLGLFMLNFPLAFGWITNPALINLVNILASLGFVVIGIGFAVAVLRYRLYDIDVIIRRTLIYAALTGALVIVYFSSIILLQEIIPPQSQLGTVLSTLAIAALFSPLRRRIQKYIDRVFYRQKYNAEQTMAAFSATARDEVNLEQLSDSLLTVVESTMQPVSVALWLKDVRS